MRKNRAAEVAGEDEGVGAAASADVEAADEAAVAAVIGLGGRKSGFGRAESRFGPEEIEGIGRRGSVAPSDKTPTLKLAARASSHA